MSGIEQVAAGYRHESGFLEAEDQTRLFWQGLEPEGGHRAAVALIHGYTCSSDDLLPMMRHFADQGLACYAIDYRGHGRSQGVPRHIFRFSEYLTDVRALCRHVGERAEERSVFLFGNSLGGLITSHYGLVHPDQLRGLVLTAPFFGPAFQVPRILDMVARAATYLCPTLRIPRRSESLPDYVTIRWWTETVAAQQAFRRQAANFRVPLLLLHGQEDGVACPRTARSLFERLGSRDKTFRFLPGARHRDLNPVCGPTWWSQVTDWVMQRVGSRRLAAG